MVSLNQNNIMDVIQTKVAPKQIKKSSSNVNTTKALKRKKIQKEITRESMNNTLRNVLRDRQLNQF